MFEIRYICAFLPSPVQGIRHVLSRRSRPRGDAFSDARVANAFYNTHMANA